MRAIVILTLGVIFICACARVQVEAPKEPIKVDITMRVDIYQHIQKDIDAIEDIVSGAQEENKTRNDQSLLDYLIYNAYAESDLNPEIKRVALRRQERYSELVSWFERGVIGESRQGLIEIIDISLSNSSLKQLIQTENNDRMIIYRLLAEENKTSVEEIQGLYTQRLQEKAPSDTPIEVLNPATGRYEWKIK